MKTEKSPRRKKIRRLIRLPILILAGAGLLYLIRLLTISYPVLTDQTEPLTGVWYSVYTEDGAASDGSDWHGLYRKGTENRLLIYFYGGGVSLYGEMDERNDEGFFYSNTDLQDAVAQIGILSDWDMNPLRNWSVLALPYATGDFHVGQSSYSYIDENGEEVTVLHRGYENYSGLMDEVIDRLGTPEALVISGSSAGGFAASLLTDELVTEYFPKTENVTVLVDSSLLLYDGWRETVEDFWNAPAEIAERLTGSNITLDSLTALRGNHEEIKILFACSLRDRKLQEYQNFIDYGVFEQTEESGEQFQENLWEMADSIENLGNAGVYLFDTLRDPITKNSRHMILPYNPFEELVDDTSLADWLMDAVDGTVQSYRAE